MNWTYLHTKRGTMRGTGPDMQNFPMGLSGKQVRNKVLDGLDLSGIEQRVMALSLEAYCSADSRAAYATMREEEIARLIEQTYVEPQPIHELLNEAVMKNYDYFHSQNREQPLPGYRNITAIQRGSKLTLFARSTKIDREHTLDRNDYDCDAQFKVEVEQWATLYGNKQ